MFLGRPAIARASPCACNPSPRHRSSVCNRSRAECALRERRAAGLRRACGGVRWLLGSGDAPGGPPRDVTSLLRSGRAKPERRPVIGAERQSPPPPPRTPTRRARAPAPTTTWIQARSRTRSCSSAHAGTHRHTHTRTRSYTNINTTSRTETHSDSPASSHRLTFAREAAPRPPAGAGGDAAVGRVVCGCVYGYIYVYMYTDIYIYIDR